MIESIAKILGRCGSENPVLPPTQLYNEGWMLRLILDWFARNRGVEHPLTFTPEACWYSEALLPSHFPPRARGDAKAESYTHADGVIGHFTIDSGERGYAKLLPGVKQFIVAEAKLRSTLSAGIKNSPTYDQAARTVACIAQMFEITNVRPDSVDRLAFFVIAPEAQIRSGVFTDLVTKQSIEKKVRARVGAFEASGDAWFEKSFLPTLVHIEIGTLAWETILDDLPITGEIDQIREFYRLCLRYNRLGSNNAI